eukprot:335356_1
MHSSFATTEQQIRLSWKVGSFCLIYSRSDNKWHNGQIQSITTSTSDMKEEKEFDSHHAKHQNEWLIVKYKNNKKTKRIQRLCKDIKPIENNYNISLNQHSYCLIYSNVLDIWCKGQIIKIFKDSEGEWLRVKYWDTNEHKICDIQRFSKDLKIYSQRLLYQSIIDIPTAPKPWQDIQFSNNEILPLKFSNIVRLNENEFIVSGYTHDDEWSSSEDINGIYKYN